MVKKVWKTIVWCACSLILTSTIVKSVSFKGLSVNGKLDSDMDNIFAVEALESE